MSGLLNFIIYICVSFVLFYSSECQVTVSNLNGNGNFLCGYTTHLVCDIRAYEGAIIWKLDGTIVAQCAFGSCTSSNALPPGDTFTPDEANGKFYLNIGITHADNGTIYECYDGLNQDPTTVNIQVPPSESAFPMNITETTTSITVEAGCFYPSDAGRMDVYCVHDGVEEEVEAAKTLTPTTTGCSGDCAGPNIYTSVGSITTENSNTGGYSRYRFKVYHKDFKQLAISKDSTANYNCVLESQVTVSNLNGTGTFLCGYNTRLECAIPGYTSGMSWKLDGTLIAQCAFGSCAALGALPSGDTFNADESAGKFYLTIGITHADNGTQYQCNDGAVQDQTTVNIQVTPSESAFIMTITETATSITVEAGCFYPSDAGRMNVYCVSGNTEIKIGNTITMTPTTTGCLGDCAGPNIYTATGSYAIDSSNTGGNSIYRFKVYHEDFKQYAISKDYAAIYNCGTYAIG